MPLPLSDLLLRTLVLLLLGALVALALRKASASLRALVLTGALAGILVLPAAVPVVPPVRLAVLPAPSQPAPADPIRSGVTNVAAVDQRDAPPTGSALINQPLIVVGAERNQAGPVPVGAAEASAEPSLFPTLLLVGWAIGLLLVLARLVRSGAALRELIRRGVTDPEWERRVADAARSLGISRPVQVRLTSDLTVPVVAGLLRPCLLMPVEATEWPEPVRRDVLLHELGHVRRWDAVSLVLGQLACAVYWFNPLVWLMERRAAALREQACDDIVLRAGTRSSDYAGRLLDLARQCVGVEVGPAALAMARPSRIRERITSVLDGRRSRRPVSRATAAGFALVGGAALLLVTAARPAPAAPALPGLTQSDAQAPDPGPVQRTLVPSPPGPDTVFVRLREPQGPCDGNLKHSSNSINGDDQDRTWRMTMEGDDCRIDLRAQGKIEFTSDFTDVGKISPGGYFRLDTEIAGVRRQLEITPRDGALDRTWRVNGREAAWDDEARRWFADFLVILDRRTAIGLDVRFPRLLAQGGPRAVLAETAQIPSDYVRTAYYGALLDRTQLSPADRLALLTQAGQLTESDFYAAELLKRVVELGRLESPAERAQVVAMIQKMDSDFYQYESVKVLGASALSSDQLSALLQVDAGMESDFYKFELLKVLLNGGQLSTAQRSTVLEAASSITSDYYLSELLKVLTARGLVGPEDRAQFLRSVAGIESDFYVVDVLRTLLQGTTVQGPEIGLVLKAAGQMESDYYRSALLALLLQGTTLSESDLLAVVRQVDGMQSDFYQHESLRRVLDNPGATDAVRRAVMASADRMSSYYGRDLKRAAGGSDI